VKFMEKQIMVRMSSELFDRAKKAADKERRPLSSWIRNLIEDAAESPSEDELS
jgi:predicted HicB family RNase H-like nuclease